MHIKAPLGLLWKEDSLQGDWSGRRVSRKAIAGRFLNVENGGLHQGIDKWGEGVKFAIHFGDADSEPQQKIGSACGA